MSGLGAALAAAARPVFVVRAEEGLRVGLGGGAAEDGLPIAAYAPAVPPGALGDPGFRADHGLRFACYSGAMAAGIGSEALAEAMGRAGMLGFFGAAGLAPARIEAAIRRLQSAMNGLPYGFNLINSPGEPDWQEAVADLYIAHEVRLVEASAYVMLSLPLIKYRVHGIHRDASGRIVTPNRVIAKVSRPEVASRFWAPPPDKMLAKLTASGCITEEQAALAREIPVAQDITVEADSGGHTDHRAAAVALPEILRLRDAVQPRFPGIPLRAGLAGGIGAPESAAAAFAMGAAYIVTGSINQSCVEAGTSDRVRAMLAAASQTDVATAPAADMFEQGVTVQVLKKGTRFAQRGARLFELYRAHGGLDEIPAADLAKIEAECFRQPAAAVWEETRAYFAERDPRQVEKAEANPKHKMALVFRWYLGNASRWANAGTPDREEDYQIWCGPAMGAFNTWVRGTFLEAPARREAPLAALNLLYGAGVLHRAQCLAAQGVPAPEGWPRVAPLDWDGLREACGETPAAAGV